MLVKHLDFAFHPLYKCGNKHESEMYYASHFFASGCTDVHKILLQLLLYNFFFTKRSLQNINILGR